MFGMSMADRMLETVIKRRLELVSLMTAEER